MNNITILAKDIEDCSECPLCGNDCPGGWTSNGAGTPIEPPCCSWNSDEEIYEGMYDYDDRDYSERELQRVYEEQKQKEKESACRRKRFSTWR